MLFSLLIDELTSRKAVVVSSTNKTDRRDRHEQRQVRFKRKASRQRTED